MTKNTRKKGCWSRARHTALPDLVRGHDHFSDTDLLFNAAPVVVGLALVRDGGKGAHPRSASDEIHDTARERVL